MALDKSKALETALGQIEKQFGKGAVMRLGPVSYTHLDVYKRQHHAFYNRS